MENIAKVKLGIVAVSRDCFPESLSVDRRKALVAAYYHDFVEKKSDYRPGDRIAYASRVVDEREMQALTDSTSARMAPSWISRLRTARAMSMSYFVG